MTARPPPGEIPGHDSPGHDSPEHDRAGTDFDPGEHRLASLLADLADDPGRPPSTVTAESVLAAVRAQGSPAIRPSGSRPDGALRIDRSNGDSVAVSAAQRRTASTALDAGTTSVFRGRRAVLVGVLAAACLAAVAAVVIPLSLRSSDTVHVRRVGPEPASADSEAVAGQASDLPRPGAADLGAPAASAAGSQAAGAVRVGGQRLGGQWLGGQWLGGSGPRQWLGGQWQGRRSPARRDSGARGRRRKRGKFRGVRLGAAEQRARRPP